MTTDTYNFIVSTLKDQCMVPGEISPESEFSKDLGLDSVGAITLMSALEMQFQISFDVKMRPPKDVRELVGLVERLRK